MNQTITFPLKYKFLIVMLFILLSALCVFLFLAQKTFSEDKKLFVMDYNLTLLQATTSEVKMELKQRGEELQLLIPRIYGESPTKGDLFQGLSGEMENEVLGVTFYKAGADGKYAQANQYSNAPLLQSRQFPPNLLAQIAQKHPLPFDSFKQSDGVRLLNRSIHLGGNKQGADAAVITFLIGGQILNAESKNLLIAVDFLQDFLRKRLQQAEMAEVFLLFKGGTLLSHPSERITVDYAAVPYPHPILERVKTKQFARESMELSLNGEDYLCNLSETGFTDVVAVSQTQKRQAFLALHTLLQRSALLALLILSASALVSVFFASGLTANIKKLQEASERIGQGDLDHRITLKSRDEIRAVGESFQKMAEKLKALIAESAQKALLEEELETARLVQSTLLTLPRLNSEDFDLVSHYAPATQCGGDYWDASLCGNLLTVFIGDATGHGAPAAIVTAVAKSCFATLTSIFKDQAIPPDELLTRLNRIIYNSCQGKLLMTMSIVQLDLATGDLLFANAGHESPLWLQANQAERPALQRKSENADKQDSGKKKKAKANVLFARGERLGFSPEQVYTCEKDKLSVGDILLLYTDGVSEARNRNNEEWGERSLKKAFGAGGARPLSVIRKEIITAVEAHMGERPPDDDVTFVLVAWKKAAGALKAAAKPPAMPGKKTAPATPSAAPPTVARKKPNLDPEAEERARTAYLYEGRETGRRKKAA